MGPAFTVRTRTESRDQASFCPFALREVSVLAELALGHLRYRLTDVPPQSNSPPDTVLGAGRGRRTRGGRCRLDARNESCARGAARLPLHRVSKETMRVVVFQLRRRSVSHLCYTSHVSSQSRTRVKLNRVFFPRRFCQARSLGCGFAG
jgi:hypothetical protein